MAEAEIDRSSQAASERAGFGGPVGIDRANHAVIEVGKEIAVPIFVRPCKLVECESTTGNASGRVMVNWSAKARIRRRAMFDSRPAVICARDSLVDLLCLSPNIVDKDATSLRLYRECKRITQTERPN